MFPRARVTQYFTRKTLQPSTNAHNSLYSNGLRVYGLHLQPVTNERLCKASAEAKLAWALPSRSQTSVENEGFVLS